MSKYVLSTAAGRNNDLIEIGGREFKAHPLTLAEADKIEDSDSLYESLDTLAPALAARAVDGEPVTSAFLAEHITKPFLQGLLRLLINGKVEADPKL